MKPYQRKILILGASALLCIQSYALPQSLRHSSPKGHHHVMLFASVLGNIAPEFSMVETSLDASLKKENLVTNRSRTYEAFTVSVTRLFVAERKTGKIFEIRGLPLEWRPYLDLVWQNNQTLVFDRWSQPHYGVHYAVNIKTKKLIMAAPFPDEFYLEQQRPKRDGNRMR